MEKELIKDRFFEGERPCFASKNIRFENCIFKKGESPIKESENIDVINSVFEWKYPLWYCKNIYVENTLFKEMSRSGIWYTNNIELRNCKIDAPKEFRRSSNIKIINTDFSIANETMWKCKRIYIKNSHIVGDYFGMNSSDIYLENVVIDGNYCFDGADNIEIHNCIFNSKDSFWNTKNVIIYDSVIIGEYLGWNSKNVTFINCKLESNQGLCYINKLKLVNCNMENTNLAFEFCSDIEAEITSKINSIKNPISGVIKAKEIGEIILDKKFIDPSKTEIKVGNHGEF